MLELMRADIDSLVTADVLKLLSSSEIEHGETSDYTTVVREIYADVLVRDETVAALGEEIKDLCADITKVGLDDYEAVKALEERYLDMSELRRAMVQGVEDLERAVDKVETLRLALILSVSVGCVAVALSVLVVVRILRKRKQKLSMRPEESDE